MRTEADVLGKMRSIAQGLGRLRPGRGGVPEEIVVPRSAEDAHPRSLSARHGLGPLPFHAETSHRSTPCRYVLLGCLDPGDHPSATLIVDWRSMVLSQDEVDLLKSVPLLVRNGGRSFYATIMPGDGRFLRYDRGCMEPIDRRGEMALDLVDDRLSALDATRHEWEPGCLLGIDNWRMLHGRGPSRPSSGRRLARISIDA